MRAVEYQDRGFVVLNDAYEVAPLAAECDRALAEGILVDSRQTGSGGITFEAVPTMCERTPASLALVDSCALIAAELLGRAVLPVRAKATRYAGDSGWHRDSEFDVASIGFATYLEPLVGATGALQVVPGSHRDASIGPDSGVAVDTVPGDVIAFDEHLMHGSAGGGDRRQWRVDFVIDPVGAAETQLVRDFYAQIFDPSWKIGHDPGLYPSYGEFWRARSAPGTDRLAELGVYDLAAKSEARSGR